MAKIAQFREESRNLRRLIAAYQVGSMRMRRIATSFLLLAIASLVSAKPEFWDLFHKHYQPAEASALFEAKCATCHVSKNNFGRNPYGKAIEELVKKTPDRSLTLAMLQQVEPSDANGNGRSNGDEIREGALPGAPGAPKTDGAPAPEAEQPLIPGHSFHPAVVHFPIALFLFGALLDFWGYRKRRDDLRSAAVIALWVGSLTSLIALPTGVAAWLRLGFALEGTLLIHLILGIVSSVMMIGVAAWRRKGSLDSAVYWAVLALTAIAVGAAGHFGAEMVF